MLDFLAQLAVSFAVLGAVRYFVRWLDRGLAGLDVYRCSNCGGKTHRPSFFRDRLVCEDCAIDAIAAEDRR